MKTITTFLTAALSPLIAGAVVAQDFSHFEYRNIGPSRGGRVTAVAGTVAEPGTFYLGASGGGVWKTEDYGTTWQVVSDGYFETPSIGDIAVVQNDANIVYVGTGSDGLRSNVIAGKGMYKSIDGGDTWEHIGLRETGQIGAVEIDPTNHNIVWVAAIGQAFNANEERGVFKTVDGGRSWERVLYHSDIVGFSDVELLPSNPNIAFATAWKAERKPWTIISGGEQDEGGLYKSVDAGVTWEKITEGLPAGLIGKIDLAVSPSHTNIVYALVEAPGDEGGLFKSVDQGNTFEQISSDSTIRTRPFYYANIEIDPRNPDVVYSMATVNKKSTDGGKTWERLRVPHEDNHDMWINPNNPDLIIQGNDGGANVTHNGGKTWSTQFNQPTAELYTVEVDDQYPYWLYAGQQDNSTTIASPSMPPFRAQDPAAWLVDSGGCETGPAIPKPGNHNIVYAECKGRFFVFDKRIGTEKEYAIGAENIYGHNPRDLKYRFQRVAPLSVSPHDPNKVYMGSQYVHVTTDGGETWTAISPDLTAFEDETQVISGSPITRDITGEEYYSTLYSLRESPVQEGVIWTGSNDGPVHVTQDGGATWEDVTPRGLPQGGRVDAVEPSPHNAAKAYISVLRYQFGDWRPYIYKTEDFGRRWEQIVNGIPDDFPVHVVREDTIRKGLLFAGTEWGMFVSLDDGENWHRFQQNMGVTPVTDLKVIRGDLAISTMGRSFWVLDNIATLRDPAFDTQSDEVLLFAPKDTIRYRNIHRDRSANGVPDYPPPAAIIDYFLPKGIEGPIRLEILDASGELVNAYESEPGEGDTDIEIIEDMQLSQSRVIVNENLSAEAGTNRFRWDMTHFGAWDEDEDVSFTDGPLVRPGEYTIRLTAGGTTADQVLTIVVDPRVIAQGTSQQDIDEQVAMQLILIDLMSEVRQFQQTVENEQADLEKRSDDLRLNEVERLLLVSDVLNAVKDDEIIYPRPMLARQISFLLNMISGADQAPGVEAADRLTELSATLADLKERYAGDN
ncbi:MAG: hypothetical protein P8M18_02055 [Woeseiaceae bacterium]|nr:hypothetical protein [Woeseiaceae bacterium]